MASTGVQLSIFGGDYIDARVKKPNYGEKILAYIVFDEPHKWTSTFWDAEGRLLSGPSLTTYSKYFEDGTYRPLAYWLPAPLLIIRGAS